MNNVFYDEKRYQKPTKDSWKNVLFELTSYCNLNCPFCLNASSTQNHEIMTFDNFKIMVDKIKKDVRLLLLSGGEPLSNPYIHDMIDYLIENQVAFHISTNGTLVDNDILEKVLSYPKVSIQFSLDGTNSETDDAIRCPGHYGKIVSLMKELNQKNFQKGIIKMVINRMNYNQIEEFFYLALKYNFLPTYAFLVKSGRANVNWDQLCIDDFMKCKARDKIRELLAKNVEYFDKYQSSEVLWYLHNMNIDYVGECQFNLEYCNFSPLIHPDGTAQPCQGLQDKEFSVGNLLSQSMDEIYSHNNLLMKKLVEEVNKRRRLLDGEKCKDCVLNETCGKGCIAEAYNSGDFYGPSSDCGMRKRDFLRAVLAQKGFSES